MAQICLSDARHRWAAAQGLDAPRVESVAATLERTGWVRTLGGLAGYLALSARNPSATVEAVNAAVASGEVGVSPAVRGCIYLVPRAHQGLALRLAQKLSEKRLAKEREKLHISDDELAGVGDAIMTALADGPRTTAQLRKQLPDGTVRSLGDAGKKMGVTSTLPPALRQLEFAGRIARTPVDARLDHERYAWSRCERDVGTWSDADATTLATLVLRWAGPLTRKELAAWTGLNQTQAKGALAAANAVAHELEGDEVFLGPDAGPTPAATGTLRWLPAMDNLFALRANARHLVDPSLHDVPVTNFGSRRNGTLGAMSQPIERTIVRDGEVLGMWAWDPETEAIVHTLSPHAADDDDAHDAERDRIRAAFSTVGHGKVFSLDTDARMSARAQRLRELRWP